MNAPPLDMATLIGLLTGLLGLGSLRTYEKVQSQRSCRQRRALPHLRGPAHRRGAC